MPSYVRDHFIAKSTAGPCRRPAIHSHIAPDGLSAMVDAMTDARPFDNTPGRKKAGWILFGIATIEGVWVVMNLMYKPAGFFRYMGFGSTNPASMWGWLAALVVTALFVRASLRFPSVRENLFRPSGLKLLGLAVAVTAGMLEEVMFRKWIMDALLTRGFGWLPQILASALAFGLLHGVWGLMGRSLRAAIGSTVATGALGGALAVVYLLSGRNLAPCVVAHFLINALIEPGLVLAATRGEMGRRVAG